MPNLPRVTSTHLLGALGSALLLAACASDPAGEPGDPGTSEGDAGGAGGGSSGGGAAPGAGGDASPGDAAGRPDASFDAAPDAPPPPPTYDDGAKNGEETDVDCGGPVVTPGFRACADGKRCAAGTDCTSLVCDPGTKSCAAPTYDDGTKNGDETDVDCGGAQKPGFVACSAGATCKVHADCASDGCAYDGRCALARSCTARFGGDTCGVGEVDDPARQHESCCTTLPVTAAGGVKLDKYNVTAGRMRAFVERVGSNVQGWISDPANKPAWWNDAWTPYLPTGDNTPVTVVGTAPRNLGVYGHLGPNFLYDQSGTFGCWSGAQPAQSGAPTYWIPTAERQAQNPNDVGSRYAKEVLDQKALNCVDFLLLAAFCAWDGGRMPTIQELDAAWNGPGGTRTYPWGNAPKPAGYTSGFPTPGDATNYSPADGDPTYANFRLSYPQTGARFDYVNYDLAAYIAPPGRFPKGAGPDGHMDLAGAVFNATFPTAANTDNPATTTVRWSRSGSWETAHGIPYGTHNSPLLRKYWAQGGRCVKN